MIVDSLAEQLNELGIKHTVILKAIEDNKDDVEHIMILKMDLNNTEAYIKYVLFKMNELNGL